VAEQAPFQAIFDENRERYRREMAEYNAAKAGEAGGKKRERVPERQCVGVASNGYVEQSDEVDPEDEEEQNEPRKKRKPKRAQTAYMAYSAKRRPEVRESDPTLSFKERAKIVAEEWREMSEAERAPFVMVAEADQERFWRELEAFEAENGADAGGEEVSAAASVTAPVSRPAGRGL
jgi:hypothetical protein